MIAYVAVLLIVLLNHDLVAGDATKKKADPNDHNGNTPFFLQDPQDGMCLGPDGFTLCNELALWILTKRQGKKTYSLVSLMNPNQNQMCLERKSSLLGLIGTDRVGMGPCSTSSAKSWLFEFIDSKHVKLSTNNQCLVRHAKKYKNSASFQSCKKGVAIPLLYHPTAVHELGFFIKSADGGCFDGNKYKDCDIGTGKLLWGVGIKYVWGSANRYFFNYYDRSQCIVAKGNKVEKGDCRHPGALKWGLIDGKLSYNNGKKCVSRLADDSAVLTKCTSSYEYSYMDVPSTQA
mmetsp:Transcript_34541/g.35210  ORF Transcript_34541/g.35210 Transcript_34541/m.35210 type:complete len:290 (-) Transcript_34541:197-1066(-)|eukprot:CAMPEP_0182421076 /NCGR_PEP_ID=MMETSP1167-20130531/6290_1 /TAXON_ID=2988 /ORGANISM="Mallomonas Sp, Strain CCMP3275" /LENGTH=289 /DNA_ID=CAMNT_0024597839 /DNA_START=65 /DNA_END=934 /DNA_ORIENTATION=-